MEWAALVTWIVTAGGGLVLLGVWLRHGGMAQAGSRGTIRPAAILGHFALAATGLVLWIVYLAADSDAFAWVAFVLLLVVAGLGFTMFAIWQRQRQARATVTQAATATSGPAQPAEQRFPVAVVALHGLAAATTLVLVLLAALEVGTS